MTVKSSIILAGVPVLQRTIANILSDLGYAVECCDQAGEAVKLFRQMRDVVIVVADLGVAGVDGQGLYLELAAQCRSGEGSLAMPAMIFLSNGSERQIGVAHSNVGIVVKPINRHEFLKTLRVVLGGSFPPPSGEHAVADSETTTPVATDPVAELNSKLDDVAQQVRQLDQRLQQVEKLFQGNDAVAASKRP